jgi:hypothetical protein
MQRYTTRLKIKEKKVQEKQIQTIKHSPYLSNRITPRKAKRRLDGTKSDKAESTPVWQNFSESHIFSVTAKLYSTFSFSKPAKIRLYVHDS